MKIGGLKSATKFTEVGLKGWAGFGVGGEQERRRSRKAKQQEQKEGAKPKQNVNKEEDPSSSSNGCRAILLELFLLSSWGPPCPAISYFSDLKG